MASIYDLDDIGFVGGQFKKPEEDMAFFTAYFKELKEKRSAQKKENPKTARVRRGQQEWAVCV
ncbi:MAG: hypothetical protein LBN98_01695 [Prevotellaceae bacterium]|jgi:hypothetical protein|nr:hypothetical protein [Prevotellaceae bacterium]